jgi:hypothetical protein
VTTVRIVVWNVRHGGTDRPGIAAALGRLAADLAVITEYRRGDGGVELAPLLDAVGLPHQAASDAAPGRNAVLVAARQPVDTAGFARPAGLLVERAVVVRWRGRPLIAMCAPSSKGDPARRGEWLRAFAGAVAREGPDALLAGTLKVRSAGPDEAARDVLAGLGRAGWTALVQPGSAGLLMAGPAGGVVSASAGIAPAGGLSDQPALWCDVAEAQVAETRMAET